MHPSSMIWTTNQEDGGVGMEYRIITKENRAEVARMAAFVNRHEKSHFLQTPPWATVKEAWDCLGEITGETATEAIIREIFEKFCVGK